MPFVLNALPHERSVCAHGNWLTFKPKQIKNIANDHLALFLTSNLAYEGLVRVSEQFEDPAHKATPDGKREFEEAEAKGLQARCTFLNSVIQNELVSLKKDLAKHNDQSDPRSYMSKGMIANMEELAEYKKRMGASKADQIAKIKEIEKALEE